MDSAKQLELKIVQENNRIMEEQIAQMLNFLEAQEVRITGLQNMVAYLEKQKVGLENMCNELCTRTTTTTTFSDQQDMPEAPPPLNPQFKEEPPSGSLCEPEEPYRPCKITRQPPPKRGERRPYKGGRKRYIEKEPQF